MVVTDWLREERLSQEAGRCTPAGIDEAGRGALAGPVVAACVVLPADFIPEGINDSKQLTEAQRERCFEEIIRSARAVGIGIVSERDIDRINILKATHIAMRAAQQQVQQTVAPDIALIDGLAVRSFPIYQKAIVKGDSKSASIASASVVAKVTRDRLMVELDLKYPGYGFAAHKGYGTPLHVAAITELGATEVHRLTFEPIVSMISAGMPAPRATAQQAILEI